MKYLASFCLTLLVFGSMTFAFTPSVELDMKIDTAFEKIIDLIEEKPDGYVDFVLNILNFYSERFTNIGDERRIYIAESLAASLIDYLSHDGDDMMMTIPSDMASDFASICKNFGGTRLEDYLECEYISAEACQETGGEYEECTSACRHEEEGTICTEQCVPVCTLGQSDLQMEDPQEVISLERCASYFDGCNTCTVGDDGEIIACTEMYCMEEGTPKCLQAKQPTEDDLKGCSTWFDGCNTCGVDGGELQECTEMDCEMLYQPACIKKSPMPY